MRRNWYSWGGLGVESSQNQKIFLQGMFNVRVPNWQSIYYFFNLVTAIFLIDFFISMLMFYLIILKPLEIVIIQRTKLLIEFETY